MPPKKEIIKEKPPAKTRKYYMRFQGGFQYKFSQWLEIAALLS
jgi:hypothetical protein